MLKSKPIVCLMALLLTGCVTPGPETKIVDTACAWTKPIYVSKSDILTDGTARQIVAHNETGAAICDWKRKPPANKK